MKETLLGWLCCPVCSQALSVRASLREGREIIEGMLSCTCGEAFPIIRSIPRFVPSDTYVDSFSLEWNIHRTTQIDSVNGSRESEERFAKSLDFPLEELQGKLVLDVGCGAGRFAGVVLKYGGTVVGVDLSYAVDACNLNMGKHPNMHIIQADIFRLPLAEECFDLIYSLGVLHHTPNPRKAFELLIPHLKKGSKVTITLYAAYNRAYVLASTFWRFLATRLPKKWLYILAHVAVPLYYLYRVPGFYHLGCTLFPISMHPNWRWRVLDTFDWYSPTYQSYHTHYEVFQWIEGAGLKDIKVLDPAISFIGQKPKL